MALQKITIFLKKISLFVDKTSLEGFVKATNIFFYCHSYFFWVKFWFIIWQTHNWRQISQLWLVEIIFCCSYLCYPALAFSKLIFFLEKWVTKFRRHYLIFSAQTLLHLLQIQLLKKSIFEFVKAKL